MQAKKTRRPNKTETKTFFANLNIYDATDNKVFCKKVKPLYLQKMNT